MMDHHFQQHQEMQPGQLAGAAFEEEHQCCLRNSCDDAIRQSANFSLCQPDPCRSFSSHMDSRRTMELINQHLASIGGSNSNIYIGKSSVFAQPPLPSPTAPESVSCAPVLIHSDQRSYSYDNMNYPQRSIFEQSIPLQQQSFDCPRFLVDALTYPTIDARATSSQYCRQVSVNYESQIRQSHDMENTTRRDVLPHQTQQRKSRATKQHNASEPSSRRYNSHHNVPIKIESVSPVATSIKREDDISHSKSRKKIKHETYPKETIPSCFLNDFLLIIVSTYRILWSIVCDVVLWPLCIAVSQAWFLVLLARRALFPALLLLVALFWVLNLQNEKVQHESSVNRLGDSALVVDLQQWEARSKEYQALYGVAVDRMQAELFFLMRRKR